MSNEKTVMEVDKITIFDDDKIEEMCNHLRQWAAFDALEKSLIEFAKENKLPNEALQKEKRNICLSFITLVNTSMQFMAQLSTIFTPYATTRVAQAMVSELLFSAIMCENQMFGKPNDFDTVGQEFMSVAEANAHYTLGFIDEKRKSNAFIQRIAPIEEERVNAKGTLTRQ